MKLAIVGSRGFSDYSLMKRELGQFDIDHIVSGGAEGADSLAQRYAKENAIPITIYYPDWDKYGKGAGPRRNARIVHNSDALIAFWDGKSRGTKDSIQKAKDNHSLLSIIRV